MGKADVARSNLVSHNKPEFLHDCDIRDLNDCNNEKDTNALCSSIIQKEIHIHSDKNVMNYNSTESNDNADKTMPNANYGAINVPHDELFINEDDINIPVKSLFNAVSKTVGN